MILRPTDAPVSKCLCELRLTGSTITAAFPEKREDFRGLMHALSFSWATRYWQRLLPPRAGDPVHRLAETAHRLVGSSFVVSVDNEKAICMAVDGSFTPEEKRWVLKLTSGYHAGWLALTWAREDDLYDEARSLPGSRWSKPFVVVPPGAVEAVADFADRHSFHMSPGAEEILTTHRHAMASGAVVTAIKDRPSPVRAERHNRPHKLTIPVEPAIAEDLRD
jgi:hypothetical protein